VSRTAPRRAPEVAGRVDQDERRLTSDVAQFEGVARVPLVTEVTGSVLVGDGDLTASGGGDFVPRNVVRTGLRRRY
jgi:hypothetical protein